MQIAMPAFSEPGMFPGQIDWDSSQGENEDYPWHPLNFTITVVQSQPKIVQLQPSQASVLGGDSVQALIYGFPPRLELKNLSVHLGNQHCPVTSKPIADLHGAFITFSTPLQNTSGLGLLIITYQSNGVFMFSARNNFLLLPEGFNMDCVEGCVHSLSRRSTNATLELKISNDQAMPDASEIQFECKIDSSLGEDFDLCRVWNFTIGFFASCQAELGKYCLKVYLQYGLEDYLRFEPPTPFTQGYFTLRSTEAFNGLSASIRFQRAPFVTNAVFSSNWATIQVTFDQMIRTDLWPKCTLLLETESIGAGSSCMWSSANIYLILLGYEAAIHPGDILEVSKNLSDISGCAVSSKTQKIIVSSPIQIQQPEISVSGPKSVSKCDAAELFAQTTSSRNHFIWGCINDDALNRIFSRNPSSLLRVEGNLLELGKTYLITVQVRTYYGTMSSVAVHPLVLSATPIPILTINIPLPPYINSRDIYVEGSAIFSKCAARPTSGMNYLWEVASVDLDGSSSSTSVILQSSNPTLTIPANTLKANQDYQIFLTAGADTQMPGKSTQNFKTQVTNIAAVIIGGNRYVHRSAILILDGSQSVDPDDCLGAGSATKECYGGKALAFQWSCFQNDDDPCRFKNGSVVYFGRTSNFLLDLGLLSASKLSGILISLLISKSGETNQQSTTINFSADPTIDAQVKLLYLTETRAAYQGLSSENKYMLNWTLVKSTGGEPLDTSDLSIFLTGISGSNFVFRLDKLLSSNIVLYGETLKVVLDVYADSGRGKAWIDLVVPIPPISGVCNVSPLHGVPLSTIFNVECKDWQGNSHPLSYSFSTLSYFSNPTDSAVTWTPQSSIPNFSIRLPEGNYSIATKIVDAHGFYTVVSSAIIQVHSYQEVDLKIMESVFDQYNSYSKTSQILMLVDAIATQLNSAPGASCEQGACRRLLGSSKSYRMNVRRLLLKSLSGSVAASISSRTAPSALKATKKVASVSSELSVDSLDAVKDQIASFQFLDVKVLQSGAIIDIMKLSGTLFASAAQKMEDVSLEMFNLQVMESILILTQKYLSGMLEGEVPLSVHFRDLSMDIMQSNQLAAPSDLIFIPSMNMSRRGIKYSAVGCGVVRLGPGLSAQADGIQRHMLGVIVWDPETPQRSDQTWKCPDFSKKCIQLGFTFKGFLNLYALNITVFRWTKSKWIDANCTINAVVQEEQNNVVANCSCDSDGLYKAVVFSPLDMSSFIRPLKNCLGIHFRVSSSWGVITVLFAFILISTGSGTAILLIYKRVYKLDLDSYISSTVGNWFETKSVRKKDYDSLCTVWTSAGPGAHAHLSKTIEVNGCELTVSAELSFPVGKTHLESVQPPIVFLDDK
jgi:hypothetical protein